MALSKDTIKKLQAVKRAILEEPSLYDQSKVPYANEFCNTPCCIAGWAIWLDGSKPRLDVFKQASKILGLKLSQFHWLFVVALLWPAPFNELYEGARNDEERAIAAGKRIDYFIATGGTE